MIKPPQKIIKMFMEWFLSDAHSSNEDFYKDTITEKHLSSLNRSEFIDFFTKFAADGGKIQSGGHRTKNQLRKTISEQYKGFRSLILTAFTPDFDVSRWLKQTEQFKYFGVGLATIFLNRVDKKKYVIVNEKTKESLALFGIDLPRKVQLKYAQVKDFQSKLIAWYPEIENFYRADALNEYLIGKDEGRELVEQLLNVTGQGPRFWVCGLGEGAKFWEQCKSDNTIVFGLDELATLSVYKTKEELKAAIVKTGVRGKNPYNDALAGWQFANEIKEGDVVIAKRGTKTYLGYGIVSGKYEHDASRTSYRNIIPVTWKKTGEWAETEGKIIIKTLTDITPYPDYVRRLIDLIGIELDGESQKVSTAVRASVTSEASGINLILYGPPGTGKTHHLTKYIPNYVTRISDEPEDSYLARLVVDKPWWQVIGAAVLECHKVRVPELVNHPIIKAKLAQTSIQSPNARLWATLQSHTVQECPNVNYQKVVDPRIFWKEPDSTWSVKEDLVTELAPEILELTKNLKKPLKCTEPKRYEFITFHQSYGYEEFVEGIRPVLEDSSEGDIQYQVVPGIFKKLCKRAEIDPVNDYAIFIDEINRGNIGKIFGELITLIEPDKRITADGNGMRVRLPYSKEEFGVPANLSIIGTMNTADRSIAFIDIALRRRFRFREMMPDANVIRENVGQGGVVDGVDVAALLETINRRIEFLYDRDHMIGHSFFLKCRDLTAVKETLLQDIIPLLQEYFYGDWEKICLVLGCGANGNGDTRNKYPLIKADKLVENEILWCDHLDYEDCHRYSVDPTFKEADADLLRSHLKGVYQAKHEVVELVEA